MIIYEIDIKIDFGMYDEYIVWLQEHIATMLTYKGFFDAKIYSYNNNDNNKYILVHYYVSSICDLNNYLDKYSGKMRNDGIKKFSNTIQIKRRILTKK